MRYAIALALALIALLSACTKSAGLEASLIDPAAKHPDSPEEITSDAQSEDVPDALRDAENQGDPSPRMMTRARDGGGRPVKIRTYYQPELRALEWLTTHQSDDGSWSADLFPSKSTRLRESDTCISTGNLDGLLDLGRFGQEERVTALVMLAFVATGTTHRTGAEAFTMRRAVKWLVREKQRHDGCLSTSGDILAHTLATFALVDCYCISLDMRLKRSAEAALRWLISQRKHDAGWPLIAGGPSDLITSTLAIKSLWIARIAGLEVDTPELNESLRVWVESLINEHFQHQEPQALGGVEDILHITLGVSPPRGEERFRQAACLLSMRGYLLPFYEQKPENSKELVTTILNQPFFSRLASDDGRKRSTCFLTWYIALGTISFIDSPDNQASVCKLAEETILPDLMNHQRGRHWLDERYADPESYGYRRPLITSQDNLDETGSWDCSDPLALHWGGRVYSTAISVLLLSNAERYLLIRDAQDD